MYFPSLLVWTGALTLSSATPLLCPILGSYLDPACLCHKEGGTVTRTTTTVVTTAAPVDTQTVTSTSTAPISTATLVETSTTTSTDTTTTTLIPDAVTITIPTTITTTTVTCFTTGGVQVDFPVLKKREAAYELQPREEHYRKTTHTKKHPKAYTTTTPTRLGCTTTTVTSTSTSTNAPSTTTTTVTTTTTPLTTTTVTTTTTDTTTSTDTEIGNAPTLTVTSTIDVATASPTGIPYYFYQPLNPLLQDGQPYDNAGDVIENLRSNAGYVDNGIVGNINSISNTGPTITTPDGGAFTGSQYGFIFQGYIFASDGPGAYTIQSRANTIDNVGVVWTGDNAYGNSWTSANYDYFAGFPSGNSVTFTLLANEARPFTIAFLNAGSPGQSDFVIISSTGTHTDTSPYLFADCGGNFNP